MRGDQSSLVARSSILIVFLAACAPGQDDCTSAIPIVAGLTPGSTVGLSSNSPSACGTLHKDAWFSYVATCTGTATATVCAPGTATFDTILAAYDGSGGCASLVPLACNDDTCASRAAVSFPVVTGGLYYLALGGTGGTTGTFTLLLSCASSVPHDECTGAIPIGNGLTTGSNVGATTSAQTAACSTAGADVWYAYTAPCTGLAEASFCPPGSAAFDTVIAVFDGSAPCGALSQIACNDDTCVFRSRATFPVNAGSLYYILVAGFGSMQGTFLLSLGCQPAPANDSCAGAIPIMPGANGPFSNQSATGGTPPQSACPTGFADLWFAFTPPCSATYRIDTCGTGFDTILSILTACTGGIEIGCNDNAGGTCSRGSQVVFDGAAGVTYLVRVAGASSSPGSFLLNVSPRFALSYTSPGGPGTIAFSMAGGPPNGIYLVVITLTQGAFPNGVFFGIDATQAEVLGFISAGPPFVGSLDTCGGTAIPSISAPSLSGVTIYSVALATDASLTLPIVPSLPVSYTIP